MAKPRRTAERFISKAGKPTFVLHGSEFGGCAHAHYMSLEGATQEEPDAFLKGVFASGHAGEECTKRDLEALGVQLEFASCNLQEQRQVSITRGLGKEGFIVLRSSLDAIGYLPPGFLRRTGVNLYGEDVHKFFDYQGATVVEIKQLSGKSLEKFVDYGLHTPGVFELYRWQVSAQVHGSRRDLEVSHGHRLPLLVVAQERTKDPSPGRPIYAWFYAEPPYTEEQVQDRCERLVRNWLERTCPPCDSEYPCRWPQPEVKSLFVAGTSKVEETGLAYLQAYDNANYWTTQAKERALELRAAMLDAGVPGISIDGANIKLADGKISVTRSI